MVDLGLPFQDLEVKFSIGYSASFSLFTRITSSENIMVHF